jgi:hypothetical protein
VRWRVLGQTVTEVRAKFADLPADALDALIEEAVTESRQAVGPKAQ